MKTLTGYLRRLNEDDEFWIELTNGTFEPVTMQGQDVPCDTLIALSVEDDGHVSKFPWYNRVAGEES